MAGIRGTKRSGPPVEDSVVSKNVRIENGPVDVGVGGDNSISASAEAATPVSVVVSPQKTSKDAVSIEHWFMLNIKRAECEEFSTKLSAEEFRNKLLKHNPSLSADLSIDTFGSAKDAMDFMAISRRMGGDGDRGSNTEHAGNRGDQPINPAAAHVAPSVGNALVLRGNPPEGMLVDDVDDVPFEARPDYPDLARRSGVESAQMSAFRAATTGSGSSIDVMRWRLPDCIWHVYAFQLLDGKDQYWSHKPQMWMLAVETERNFPLFPGSPFTLHRAMNKCNSAAMRAVPCGDDSVKQIKTKKHGKLIDQHLLYGLAKADKTNDEIASMIKSFVEHCKKPEIRQAYFLTITSKMQSNFISEDCQASTGKYWIKLASGASNISVKDMSTLDEVFLNEDIVYITNLAYGTRGAAVQDWNPAVRSVAFRSI
jgi:hypothetical protein